MEQITDHKVNGLNEAIDIEVVDGPGPGGACHFYDITLHQPHGTDLTTAIRFQKGAIGEVGFNGITVEVLMAICIHRLKGFQSGQFSTKENSCALTHLQESLMWLQQRTRDRLARGVEGKMEK